MANPKVYLQMLDETSGEYVNVDPRSCAEAITCNNNINLQNHLNTIYTNQGDLSALTTTIKDNLVDAINEVNTGSLSGIIDIAHGGTGATTESEALANLGGASTETYTATVYTTWTGDSAPYTQTVDVSGITESDNPIVDVVLDSNTNIAKIQLESWSCVSRIVTGTNQILITCLEDKPTTAFTIQLKVVR